HAAARGHVGGRQYLVHVHVDKEAVLVVDDRCLRRGAGKGGTSGKQHGGGEQEVFHFGYLGRSRGGAAALGSFDGKDQGWRPAACRIRSATSSAWETSDRWLDGNSMVLAPMRLARKRCRSGLMVWSLLETAYQDGLSCQAAAWVRAENRVLAMGCCAA